jgi:hypothetical protein
LYDFFWVIPRRLNLDNRELPRRKHTAFRTWQNFEIKNGKELPTHFQQNQCTAHHPKINK